MKRALICILLASFLASLVLFSIRLAGNCAYAVDECQNVYMAMAQSAGQGATSHNCISLFLFPLMWIARGAEHSAGIFVSARFFALELFWLNLVLLVAATGAKLLRPGGLIALAAAATLAPLWNFGLEARPDNLVLTGLLLMWCVLRVRPRGIQSYAIAGFLAAGLEFVSGKSLVYTLSLSLAALLFPPSGHTTARWRFALAWLAGAIAAAVLVGIVYRATGMWNLFLESLHHIAGVPSDQDSVNGAWKTFSRLFTQTPLLLAFVAGGLVSIIAEFRRGKEMLSWNTLFPEAALFLVAVMVFFSDPRPAPYNLLYVTAFAFLFAFRYASAVWEDIAAQPAVWLVAATVVLFGHLVPFGVALQGYSTFTNYRQEALMGLAEQMTDAAKDPIYDGIGMVPARRSIGFQLPLRPDTGTSAAGPQTSLREAFAAGPAVVVVPNYRTDWLPAEDKAFIQERYVPLADDFWVLGKIVPAGGGTFEIIQPGRYRITSAEASNILGTYPQPKNLMESMAPEPKFPPLIGTLDGAPFDGTPVELTTGTHHLSCAEGTRAAVVWIGPRLDHIQRMSLGDHRRLFVKWF